MFYNSTIHLPFMRALMMIFTRFNSAVFSTVTHEVYGMLSCCQGNRIQDRLVK